MTMLSTTRRRMKLKSSQRTLFAFIFVPCALAIFIIIKNEGHDSNYNNSVYDMETDLKSRFIDKNESFDLQEQNKDNRKVNGKDNGQLETETEAPFSSDFCSAISTSSPSFPSSKSKSIPSSITLWSQHLNSIFTSSRHGDDFDYTWHDFTLKLLQIMTPQRLLYGAGKSIPKNDMQWTNVGHVLNIGFQRWKYVQDQLEISQETNNNHIRVPRKVNILVMGGSVTMGVQCRENPIKDISPVRRDCAWPSRLHQFLNTILLNGKKSGKHNKLLDTDIIRVDVLTLGGTNTETGTTIFDYTLMPHGIPYPDIVINGYSTNDMHVTSAIEAQKRNITLEEMILQVNQKFIRKVLVPKVVLPVQQSESEQDNKTSKAKCLHRPPLLFYYDDYIGNEQRQITQTHSFSKSIQFLSSYYGFSVLSYADAVKDLVYAKTSDNWFAPHGWPDRQVHPGMGMHIVSTWIMAFHLAHLGSTYCSLNSTRTTYSEILPKLRNPQAQMKGEPVVLNQNHHHHLPPEINDSLTLDNISQKWNDNNNDNNNNQNDGTVLEECSVSNEYLMSRPCMFSWIGNLERKFDKAKHLQDRIKPFLTTNEGWVALDENSKLGYCATKENAFFELEFQNIVTPVKTLTFLVMKSYGKKWENSKIQVEAKISKQVGTPDEKTYSNSIEITGFHDKKTSETYTAQLNLASKENGIIQDDNGFSKSDSLKVRITLIGGSTFKIMGMAFCDH